MATILQSYGTNATLTMDNTFATLANGAVSKSDEIDNSAGHLVDDLQISCTTETTPTGTVDVYTMRANDTGDYPSTDQLGNLNFLMSLDTSAATPLTNKRMEQLPEFYKVVVVNDSGFALSGAVMEHQVADLTNA